MKNVEYFLNDKFIVLKMLYEHQMDINGTVVCPITQQELADISGFSKAKINSILNELIKNQYVQIYNNTKGRYVILDEAIKTIKKLL
ncbi:helix-turn-helix domain-containing protein [Clostridium sp. Mt-5]|uniref:Helix-turn-helix domain-containing protein n=1 Tax=Clostridium moutaii TaxID=3240932 RepID=A0ABV4BQS5_9CLOT